MTWIEVLLKDQLLRIINGGTSTQCFLLERGAHQGGSISTYLFMLKLDISFFLLKTPWNKKYRNN